MSRLSVRPILRAPRAIMLSLLGLAGCTNGAADDDGSSSPDASIVAPVPSATFRGGDSIAFAGEATDPEEGLIPESRLTWWVELHHDTHTHPFLDRTPGRAGAVFVPPLGHPDQNIFLRFHLEAIDLDGHADTTTLDLSPETVTFALLTEPAGLSLTLDGQPHGTPEAIAGVVGMARELGAPSPQTVGTTVYEFVQWSDGGSVVHMIATPEDSTLYLARFRARTGVNLAPTVSLTSPANGATLAGGTPVTVAATASDPDGTVQRVRFFDGSQMIGEDLTAPFSISWTPRSAGSHALSAQATDNLGSTVASLGITVHVTVPENLFPTVTLTAPGAGASLLVSVPATLTATASDPDGTIVRVAFYEGGANLLGEDTSAPYSVSWTPTRTGSFVLSARAIDNQGFAGTSANVNVTVRPAAASDNQPPTLVLTSPVDGTTGLQGSMTFAVSASDNVGVTRVEYQVDAEPVGESAAAPWSLAFTSAGNYTAGVHVVRARARDAAGNVSAWSAARVTFGGNRDRPSGVDRSAFVRGLRQGTAMAFAPDGRLFICQQNGAVRVARRDGSLLNTPLLTVSTSATGERGLLGIALHPQFSSNGWVFVYYTAADGGPHNRISRFTVVGDVALPGSETIIADLPPLSSATNHNGGALHFGPDGKLYVAVGDNADGGQAPRLTSVFGKMLRLNHDGTIPGDNPYHGSTSGLNRAIWARGLRNPFSFAFDPANAMMFINDVGQNRWEEINRGRAGADYGWPSTEGSSGTAGTAFDAPIFAYGHSPNSTLVTGFAIVGGTFYRPPSLLFPNWSGHYFFGDYVAGWVHRLDPANGNAVYAFANVGGYLTDVLTGPDGAIYVLADRGEGWQVLRYGR